MYNIFTLYNLCLSKEIKLEIKLVKNLLEEEKLKFLDYLVNVVEESLIKKL